jgi:hypothetical protein
MTMRLGEIGAAAVRVQRPHMRAWAALPDIRSHLGHGDGRKRQKERYHPPHATLPCLVILVEPHYKHSMTGSKVPVKKIFYGCAAHYDG